MGSVFGRIDVECPAHTVLKTAPWGEVRSYPELVSIEANDAANDAFGKLAGFIGVTGPPKNDAAMPVAMTAPVFSALPAGGEKTWPTGRVYRGEWRKDMVWGEVEGSIPFEMLWFGEGMCAILMKQQCLGKGWGPIHMKLYGF